VANGYPAGEFHVEGAFAASHRAELEGLIRRVEEDERAKHPLKRIMAIASEGSGFVVTVTDAKLTRALGRALRKAYEGRLQLPPTSSEQGNLVRVRWSRD
jgi:hypothetical protein